MSPHIKAVDDVVVLGVNLSRFDTLSQLLICVAGVFVFYLLYGYLQVTGPSWERCFHPKLSKALISREAWLVAKVSSSVE